MPIRDRVAAVLLFGLVASSTPSLEAQERSVPAGSPVRGTAGVVPNPVLFVTQVPVPADFATIGSVFANHRTHMMAVARGGDLWILYPNGTLRNLTEEAGFGQAGGQASHAIAVRGPSVHWNGEKAVFSMLRGAPSQQYVQEQTFWQLYEVTGLGEGDSVSIGRVPRQPSSYNNVSPAYLSDGRIVFVSDRPRGGTAHHYPQLDEYESTPTPTGLWSLDPESGELVMLNHAPSGSFTPIVDSFGRVIFTRWDHLQQDQQADADALGHRDHGSFNYASESARAERLPRQDEIFPEPRSERTDLLAGTNLAGHTLNQFLPWQINQDGTSEEMLNHVGRHELASYFDRAFNDDPNLVEFIAEVTGRVNPNELENILQMREDPTDLGRYVGTDAPEFGTHAAGQLVALDAPPERNPDDVTVSYLTDRVGRVPIADGATPPAGHRGFFRDPLPLSDGTLIAAHTHEKRYAENEGTRAAPDPRYDFRLRTVTGSTGSMAPGVELTSGISETVSWWDPDVRVTYSGPLWELEPVEVRARPVPPAPSEALAGPEQAVFDAEGIAPDELQSWMRDRQLALLVVRDVTSRDDADLQQPYNLRVPGGKTTRGTPDGKLYDLEYFQFFQGDLLRGYGGTDDPRPGRRVLAQYLHDEQALALTPLANDAPPASVEIHPDGSVAAFVPAQRALAWQSTDSAGTPVVRERFWITAQPGEIRACDGCHGVNRENQEGNTAATSSPAALATLLRTWKSLFGDDFESQGTTAWSRSNP